MLAIAVFLVIFIIGLQNSWEEFYDSLGLHGRILMAPAALSEPLPFSPLSSPWFALRPCLYSFFSGLKFFLPLADIRGVDFRGGDVKHQPPSDKKGCVRISTKSLLSKLKPVPRAHIRAPGTHHFCC